MGSEIAIVLTVIIGLIVAIAVLVHRIGPTLLIFALSPIDPILGGSFGTAGNYITGIPIALLLFKNSPAVWIRIFFGTRVQIAMFLFVAFTAVGHLMSLRLGVEAVFLDYLQKVAGFLIVGVVGWGLRDERYVDLCMKVLVVGMTFFALLSMIDFYLGIQLVPNAPRSSSFFEGAGSENVNLSRLRGVADSLPINRFALQLLVPIGLAMGWLSPKVRRGIGILPIVCLIILLTALFGTISRGGLLSLAVGAAVVSVAAYRLRPASVLGTLILALVLAGAAAQTLSYLGLDDQVGQRLSTSELNTGSTVRQRSWAHGLRLFAESPIWGVGYGVWATENVRPGGVNPDPHNAYIRILAFYGLLGGAFFAYFIYTLYASLTRSAQNLGDRLEHWRPYFLAGLTALLTMNLFNSYFFDRYLFLVAGFAAALEHSRRDLALRAAAESRQRDSEQLGADRLPGGAPSWTSVHDSSLP